MYMKRRSVAAARANLPSLLDDVERGQVIEISRRGKAIAWLVPSLAPLDQSAATARFRERVEAWRARYGDTGGFEPEFFDGLRDRTKDGK
jgi:prevent-host-death family protein